MRIERAVCSCLLGVILGACAYKSGLDGGKPVRGGFFTPAAQAGEQRISLLGPVPRYTRLHSVLLAALQRRGVRVVASGKARTHLHIHSFDSDERAMTYGRDAKARDVMLTLTLSYSWSRDIGGRRGREFGPRLISARGLYQHDDRRYLINRSERRRVHEELEDELIRRLMQRLRSGS